MVSDLAWAVLALLVVAVLTVLYCRGWDRRWLRGEGMPSLLDKPKVGEGP